MLEIAALLSKELDNCEADAALPRLLENYNGDIKQLSVDTFHAMQICLEFLDKGMKGLLTGDFSTYAL